MRQSTLARVITAVLGYHLGGLGERPRWIRYGFALVSSLTAVALTIAFQPLVNRSVLLMVWPAVLISTWVGGTGAGLFSALLALLLIDFFVQPPPNVFSLDAGFVSQATVLLAVVVMVGTARKEQAKAMRAHRASQQQVIQILEGVSEPFYGLDKNWRFTYVNHAAEQMWGRQRAQLVGRHIWEEFPSGVGSEAYQVMHRAMRENAPQRIETLSSFLNRWVEVNVYPTPIGLSVYFRDIDERRRTEEALRESRHFIEQVANATPHIIYIYDLQEHHNVYANREMAEVLGYTPEQVQAAGNTFFPNLVHPDDRAVLPSILERLIHAQDGEIIENEFRARSVGGEWRWLHSREAVFTRDPEGRPRQVVGTAEDITARKQAEQRAAVLQAITARFSEAVTPAQIAQIVVQEGVAAMEGSLGGVCVLTQDGTALEMLGHYNVKQELCERFSRIPLDQPTPFSDVVRSAQPLWIHTREEFLALYPHFKDIPVRTGSQSSASVPLKVNARVIGVFGVSFNQPHTFSSGERELLLELAHHCAQALERARLYEAESKARQQAEEADRLKMQFLGMISHELRTPLTSVKGFTTTLLAQDVVFSPEEQRQFLTIINEEADKLTELVDQLLDLSRLQAGKLDIHPEPQALTTIFENAESQLKALTAQHTLVMQTDEPLPVVLADRRRVAQVLTNLVSNAAKFSPPDTPITLSARAHDGEVQIDVCDQGTGIPPEARALVFEAFRQVERKGGSSVRGAGLGLAICKGIIEAHGKRIWISDNAPQGTVVSFTLPIASDS